MSAWFGVALLPLTAVAMLATGLPAFLVLIGAAGLGALWVQASGGDTALLAALGARLVALLEGDLLQALPLFVIMGVLLNRLPLVEILFRTGCAIGRQGVLAPRLSALAIGALVAPMNGSVGASVSMLSRGVRPLLARHGVEPAERVALVAAASTLGVVIPPSLVLLFLGDAMMNAHSIAMRAIAGSDRVVNTQDIFRAAAAPAALTMGLWILIVALRARAPGVTAERNALSLREALISALVVTSVVLLLGGVAAGMFYAVEAAATGCAALLAVGVLTRALTLRVLAEVLREALAVSGALFALLAAATTFTLVMRVLGVDRLATDLLASAPGGPAAAAAAALALMAVAALVLDAFEIVFVIVPIVMPGVLMRAPDAAWVAALAVLTLQASFLSPPLGYAIMMTRATKTVSVSTRAIAWEVAPFLMALIAVILVTLAFPSIAHVFDRPETVKVGAPAPLPEKFDIPLPEAPPPEIK